MSSEKEINSKNLLKASKSLLGFAAGGKGSNPVSFVNPIPLLHPPGDLGRQLIGVAEGVSLILIDDEHEILITKPAFQNRGVKGIFFNPLGVPGKLSWGLLLHPLQTNRRERLILRSTSGVLLHLRRRLRSSEQLHLGQK